MKLREVELELIADGDDVVATLGASVDLEAGRYIFGYPTRTGALLSIDGVVRGAFDREHEDIEIALAGDARRLELRVERRSLPTSGLPSGDGPAWRAMLARAGQEPAKTLRIGRSEDADAIKREAERGTLTLIGHAHLDVAWLWTYEEARRKAARTFATAVRLMSRDAAFVFTQSQPQLYTWVAEDEPALFADAAAYAREGRFDATGASLWVEPDCNIPSGESLLRQMIFGKRFVGERLGAHATVAWLPDTFGFAATLPTLLRHARIDAFATTKLEWNDTNRFPHPRFWWAGPDGSRVAAALFASYEGDFERKRERIAEHRREPLVLGYGDGGGGATDDMIVRAKTAGSWTTLQSFFATVRAESEKAPLPEHRDELYLEYHRGVYTTHRAIKTRNAALERRLREVEELGAWARALHASPFFLDEFRTQIREAWEIVLRAQFHDVITGTSIDVVYDDVRADYDRAGALLDNLANNARSVLPRTSSAQLARREAREIAPRLERPLFAKHHDETYLFESDLVVARVDARGAIVHLREAGRDGAPSCIERANELRAFRDKPAKWDAWNIDASYRSIKRSIDFEGAEIVEGGLEVRFHTGESPGVMRLALRAGEPFLRVDIALDWREEHTIVRAEGVAGVAGARARFGAPHGIVERSLDARSSHGRARFEVPGQRYMRIDGARGGLAVLSLDGYGWNARTLRDERIAFGHSLIRGPRWPDPHGDTGPHTISLAYMPLGPNIANGELEARFERFAGIGETAMFTCADTGIAIVATKLADSGDAVIVRARECDGLERDVTIRCAARATAAEECDALERPYPASAPEGPASAPFSLEASELRTRFAPYQLRSFRIKLA